LSIIDVWGEEDIENIVFKPVGKHVDEDFIVVHDGVTILEPHVVGCESAVSPDVGSGDGVDIVVWLECSLAGYNQSDEDDSGFHFDFFIKIYIL
jgi:hypothetical protein